MSELVERRHVLEPFLNRVEKQTAAECGVAMEVLPFRGYFNLRGDPKDNDFLDSVGEVLGQPLPAAANTFTGSTCRAFWLGPDEWLIMTEPGVEEPSAGEREGAPLARERASAGEREGAPLARERASAGEREGAPLARERASAGEREGAPLARERASAGEREGAPLARERASAGEREGAPLAWEDPQATRLSDALSGRACALTDLTGAQICIRLSGANARNVLAKGCTLDFHPGVFRPGSCAQTVLGKASMLVCLFSTGLDPAGSGDTNAPADSGHADNREVFDIIVRRTFAEYAADWLYRSAEEYGVRVHCHG